MYAPAPLAPLRVALHAPHSATSRPCAKPPCQAEILPTLSGLIVICWITALGDLALASKWQRTAPEAGMPSKRGFAFLCAQHLPALLLAMISPPLPKQADNLPAGVRGENSHNSSDCHAFHSVCTPMNGAM